LYINLNRPYLQCSYYIFKADQRIDKEFGIAATSLYLLLGMSLLAMTFNLVQQRVVDKVRRAGVICGVVKEEEDDDGFAFD